jgi:hypothetical protein
MVCYACRFGQDSEESEDDTHRNNPSDSSDSDDQSSHAAAAAAHIPGERRSVRETTRGAKKYVAHGQPAAHKIGCILRVPTLCLV